MQQQFQIFSYSRCMHSDDGIPNGEEEELVVFCHLLGVGRFASNLNLKLECQCPLYYDTHVVTVTLETVVNWYLC